MKGVLYLRVTEESRARFEALGAGPFTYTGGGRTVTVARYYEVPGKVLEDEETLSSWAVEACRTTGSPFKATQNLRYDQCFFPSVLPFAPHAGF